MTRLFRARGLLWSGWVRAERFRAQYGVPGLGRQSPEELRRYFDCQAEWRDPTNERPTILQPSKGEAPADAGLGAQAVRLCESEETQVGTWPVPELAAHEGVKVALPGPGDSGGQLGESGTGEQKPDPVKS